MVSPHPHQAPSHPKGKCCFGVTLLSGPLLILVMLGVCVPAAAPKMPEINLEYWWSYEDLEECMHPVKELSLLLESSTEPTIHNTLDYVLSLLYERLEMSPKRHVATCTVYNTFVDTIREKLLMLLGDVEQFLLWVVAAMLDGRRIGFDWLNPVWDNKHDSLNVTQQFKLEMCAGQNLQERERKETRSKRSFSSRFFSFFLFPRTGLSSLSYLSWD